MKKLTMKTDATAKRWNLFYYLASLLVVLLFASSGSLLAQQTTYFVRTDGAATNTGATWETALNGPGIAAKMRAEAIPNGSTIYFAAGTYVPGTARVDFFSIRATGITMMGGYPTGLTGTSTANRNVTANKTILSGEIGTTAITDNIYHVVYVAQNSENVTIDGFTITRGYADDGTGGGAIAAGDGTNNLTLKNLIIVDNESKVAILSETGQGGGVLTKCTVVIENCLFQNNRSAMNGAAFYSGAACSVSASTFTSNTSKFHGGAVALLQGGAATFTSCSFTKNSSDGSGGAVFAGLDRGVILFNSCTVTENVCTNLSASTYNGSAIAKSTGGIIVEKDATFAGANVIKNNAAGYSLDRTTVTKASTNCGGLRVDGNFKVTGTLLIDGNKATGDGGGFWLGAGANPETTGGTVTISNNEATTGGGIYATSTIETATCTNFIIRNNTATANGGGAYINATGGLKLVKSLVSANTGNHGGGIFTPSGSVTSGLKGRFISESSTYTNNTARLSGGAITAYWEFHSTNDLITNNTGGNRGGGISMNKPEAGENFSSIRTITSSTITGNSALQQGGGISVWAGNLTFAGVPVISANTVTAGNNNGTYGGGGIYFTSTNGGTLTTSGTLTVANNKATNSNGGGIYTGTTISIPNLVLSANTATSSSSGGNYTTTKNAGNGGGLYVSGATPTVSVGGSITNNIAAFDGGGIMAPDGAIVTISDSSLIRGNRANGPCVTNGGGGIFIGSLPNLMVEGSSTFTNNFATNNYPIADKDTLLHQTKILAVSFSSTFTNAYNNFDVNYIGGANNDEAASILCPGGQGVLIDVSANDRLLTCTSGDYTGSRLAVIQQSEVPNGGIATVEGNKIRFVPGTGSINGDTEKFQYQITCNQCSGGTSTAWVNVKIEAQVEFAPPPQTAASACPGETFTVTAKPVSGASYCFTNNGSLCVPYSTANSQTFTMPNSGNQTITMVVQTAAGCTATASVVVQNNAIAIDTQPATFTDVCSGGSVTLSVTPANASDIQSYQWYRNGVSLGTAATNTTYTASETVTAPTRSTYTVVLTGKNGCSIKSDDAVIRIIPMADASKVIAEWPPICSGETFTLTISSPTDTEVTNYIWYPSQESTTSLTTVAGTRGKSYIPNPFPTTSTTYYIAISENNYCETPTNQRKPVVLTITPTVTPMVTITSGSTICAGSAVTFTATPVNGGTSPTYQWQRNGVDVPGATDNTYTASDFVNNEVVTCVLFSSEACASPATSTGSIMKVNNCSPSYTQVTNCLPSSTIDLATTEFYTILNCTQSNVVVRTATSSVGAVISVPGVYGVSTFTYTPPTHFIGVDTVTITGGERCREREFSTKLIVTVVPCPDNINTATCFGDPIGFDWAIKEDWRSTEVDVTSYIAPVVADLNDDGIPEILAARYYSGNESMISLFDGIYIYWGHDRSNPTLIPTAYSHYYNVSGFATAKVNMDGTPTPLIVMVGHDSPTSDSDQYLYAYRPDGTRAWKSTEVVCDDVETLTSNTAYHFAVGFADFDNDGKQEVYVGNRIFDAATGTLLVEGPPGGNKGESRNNNGIEHDYLTVAADMNGDGRLELVAGTEVYQVTIDRQTPSNNKMTLMASIPAVDMGGGLTLKDGHTVVADINQDGRPDVIVAAALSYASTATYAVIAWDVQTQTLIGSTGPQPTNSGFVGIPFIGNIDNEPGLEILLTSQVSTDVASSYPEGWIRGYRWDGNTSLKEVYNAQTSDLSGCTGITLFDFNQDGIAELVYRDETHLRIMKAVPGTGGNPGTLENLDTFEAHSGTYYEYPVVADVDNDGAAEIVVIGAATSSNRNRGSVRIYRSGNQYKWAPGRKVWNQYAYNVVNINEDLTVPAYQLNPATLFNGGSCGSVRPYNAFLQQQTLLNQYGCPLWILPKIEWVSEPTLSAVVGDSVVFTGTIKNTGEAGLIAPIYISSYKNTVDPNNVIQLDSIQTSLLVGEQYTFKVVIKNISSLAGMTKLIVNVNDKKTGDLFYQQCNVMASKEMDFTVNKEIIAVDDYVAIWECENVTINVLANDSYDGTVEITIVNQGTYGNSVAGSNVVYTSGPNCADGAGKTDVVRYKICYTDDPTHCPAANIYVTIMKKPAILLADSCSIAPKLQLDLQYLGATYQWQRSADGNTWTDIAGATGVEIAATEAGYYRVQVTYNGKTIVTPVRHLQVLRAVSLPDGTIWYAVTLD